jgi:hypothetical protein
MAVSKQWKVIEVRQQGARHNFSAWRATERCVRTHCTVWFSWIWRSASQRTGSKSCSPGH